MWPKVTCLKMHFFGKGIPVDSLPSKTHLVLDKLVSCVQYMYRICSYLMGILPMNIYLKVFVIIYL